MRRYAVLIVVMLASPCSLAAQSFDVDAMQARARVRGWRSELATSPVGRGEIRWCPPSQDRCAGPYERTDAEVLVVVSGASSPSMVMMREQRGGWTVELSLDLSHHTFAMRMTRGADVVRIGWETFVELPDGSTLHAPHTDLHAVDHAGWLRAELEAYLASAESFRARLALRDGELRAHMERVMSLITICPAPSDPSRFRHLPGPDGARGMVDTCARRPLDDEERGALRARLAQETGQRERLAREHAATWHAMLIAMLARR